MVLLAAPGNTWGIPGPLFLGLYLVTAAVLVTIALLRRNEILNGSTYDANLLSPQQVAYLSGGTPLTVWTALAGLRSAGAINVDRDRRLTASGSLPIGSSPLDQAINLAASRGLRAQELSRDRGVRQAVHQLRADLVRHGLALSIEQRAALRNTALLLTGLFAVGMLRLAAGLANERPVGWLFLTQVALLVVIVLLFRRPWRTRTADRVLRRLRHRHTHLAPHHNPAYATYGAAGAAMGVALFGTAALWAMDPGFAEQAQIQQQFLAGGSTAGGGGTPGVGNGGDGGGGGCGG
ncbi:TIGR04222 domain-containing membrane protein [Salinispora sp. H7-4]|uniref:TIGR04222 domain-containing membrane protein n=1 Tax=Salinispora sp. H7-4 TaxID=2748321 RepID=UPI0015D1A074|nr:TIGR04222 domain-containing membrane protein [Salinispora sp. H7-4]NYT95773.1 TIGR04222 domain-containing membrane protein [Salinispora sp. H7-4]